LRPRDSGGITEDQVIRRLRLAVFDTDHILARALI